MSEISEKTLLFYKVSDLLKQIRAKIKPFTEATSAGFETPEDFLTELNEDIAKIETCDISTLNKINTEFLPTGTYQELSLSNGWADEYSEMADTFDELYTAIQNQ